MRFNVPNINTPSYWDKAQTCVGDFGLRQQIYSNEAGSGERILELGCGLSPFLSQSNFKEKWGVDFSEETVRLAVGMYYTVNYKCEDATKTSFDDKYFDVVVAGEMIEHLEYPEELIKEMVRLAKHKIILSTPILEFKEPEHLWEFSEADLLQMMPNGTKVKTVESSRFPGRKYLFAVCALS